MTEIQTYYEDDREEIIALILHCQNDGTRPLVSVDDQPELLHIKEKYIDSGGNFWLAKEFMIAETDKDGISSQRILQRCGFAEEKRGETIWWRL